MPSPEIVITGVGLVTPLGETARESTDAWRDGHCARTRRVPELESTPLESQLVAAGPGLNVGKRLGGRRLVKYMSDAARLGCVAAHEAMADAGVQKRFAPQRIGLYAGTGLAAAHMTDVEPLLERSIDSGGEFSCRLLGERGLAEANPLLSFKILANMPACLISIQEEIRGPNLIFSPWEGQTGAAIVEAWLAVADGEVDCALVGAAEDATQPVTVTYLRQAGLLQEREYPAAGAGYLVLERRSSAERDGIAVYARLDRPELRACSEPPDDPLRERMGRTFAAAPAILLGMGSVSPPSHVSVRGVDQHIFEAKLEGVS
jgi:3-oxoacyl-[acyl-carrier-protein] synthase II